MVSDIVASLRIRVRRENRSIRALGVCGPAASLRDWHVHSNWHRVRFPKASSTAFPSTAARVELMTGMSSMALWSIGIVWLQAFSGTTPTGYLAAGEVLPKVLPKTGCNSPFRGI